MSISTFSTMLAPSATFSTSLRSSAKPPHSQLLLRGTRDGDLAATLSSSASTSYTAATSSALVRTPLFTWADLLRIIGSGNLQQLSRHPEDLREYFAWTDSVKSSYGSVQNFLLSERFTASYLLDRPSRSGEGGSRCFRSHFVEGRECQVLVNDWPYSVPSEVTHHVVWSYLPILHPDLVCSEEEEKVRESAWGIIAKRGLCGTLTHKAGLTLPTLAEHKTHLPHLIASIEDAGLEGKVQNAMQKACQDLVRFIKGRWDMQRYEAAFFANPPSLQSVPSLAHFHVLIRPL